MLESRAGDAVGQVRTGGTGGGGRMASEALTDLAREVGKAGDPVVRQGLARLYTLTRLGKMSALRAKSPAQRTGGEANIAKLMMSDILRLQRELGNHILGAHGMVMGRETPGRGAVQELTLFSPGPSIYGGTDQVQRNILGERVLGLPKEPGPAKDTPFRELAVGTQAK
jgi:alkylation response protein AidB-like acyl-CoA dehydrogenase